MTRILCLLIAACSTLAVLVGCGSTAPGPELVSSATLVNADAVPRPTHTPAVLLTGAIENTNDGRRLALDLDTLERLKLVRYRVRDPWAKRDVVYTGVLLSDLLEFARARGRASRLRMTALDDYKTTIAVSDVARWPILLATRSDGKRIPVARGGPTRVVFPYGQFKIDPSRYNEQWIWSVKTIDVR